MYPTKVTFKHQKSSSRWWALFTIVPVKMLALIPSFIVLYVLQLLATVAALLGIVGVLFTGKYLVSVETFIIGVIRWQWRLGAFLGCLTDKYPPFTLKAGGHPADLSFKHQEKSSRYWALLTIIPVKFILLIPHFVVMMVLGLIADVCFLLGPFFVLFTGKYPKAFEKWILRALKYMFRLNTYVMCLTDKYPPISWE